MRKSLVIVVLPSKLIRISLLSLGGKKQFRERIEFSSLKKSHRSIYRVILSICVEYGKKKPKTGLEPATVWVETKRASHCATWALLGGGSQGELSYSGVNHSLLKQKYTVS